MKMTPVKSSNLTHVGYDSATRELAVTFTSGKTYRYADVPDEVVARFMEAESKGSFFARNIKGKFQSPEGTGA